MGKNINIHDAAFWFCLFFLTGIVLTSVLNGSFYLVFFIVLLTASYFLLVRKYNLAIFTFVALLGFFYFQIYSYIQSAEINIHFGKSAEFQGVITEVRSSQSSQDLTISLRGNNKGTINVRAALYPEFQYGDLIKFNGVVNKPTGEYKNYYLSRNIIGLASFPSMELIAKNQGNFIKSKLFSFREKIKNIFKTSLSKEKAAFLAGITIGAREDFSKEFKEKMSLSGTTHLIALSGYNISVITLAVGLLFSSFFGITISFYLTILTIILFVIMAGAEASVVRAAIMGSIALFAVQTERLASPRNAIVIAAFIMSLFNPRVLVFDVGFQLSFAALLGIVYVDPVIKKIFHWQDEEGFLGWKKNATATASAQIMALPILFSSFGLFSLTSILANILILELIPLTMALGFIMAGLGFVSIFFAKILGFLVNVFISYEFFIIDLFSKFALLLRIENINWLIWVVYYSAIFGLVVFFNKIKRDA